MSIQIGNAIRGYACFTWTEFTISDSVAKLHVFLQKIKIASVLIRITEQMKQTLGSAASNKYAYDRNLVRLKCGVECDLRCWSPLLHNKSGSVIAERGTIAFPLPSYYSQVIPKTIIIKAPTRWHYVTL